MLPSQDNGPLRIGDVFEDDFQILELMGEGGYGCVYRAMEKYTSREVAIKVTKELGKQNQEIYERTLREAKILGALGSHLNIVQVFGARFSKQGQFYIVMELLKGSDLGRHIKKHGSFEVRDGLILLQKLCEALGFAHEKQVIHRDIKPGNIFVPEQGEPKLLDFGVAKIADFGGFQTAPHRLIGTTLYVSPEQIRGKPVTARSDIYALGLVAFQIFHHGRHPLLLQEPDVDRYNAREICNLHLRTPAPRLDEVIDGFPEYVAKLVNTMVAKEPGQRFGNATELAGEFRAALLRYDAEQKRNSPVLASYTPTVAEEAAIQRAANPPAAGGEAVLGEALGGANAAPAVERSTKKLFEEGKNNLPQIPVATFTRPEPRTGPDLPATPPSISRTKTIPGEHTSRTEAWKQKWGMTPAQLAAVMVVGLGLGGGIMFTFAGRTTDDATPLAPGEVVIESVSPVAASKQAHSTTPALELPNEVKDQEKPSTRSAEEAPGEPPPASPVVAEPQPEAKQQTAPTKAVPPNIQDSPKPAPRPKSTRKSAEPEKSEFDKLLEEGTLFQ